MSKDRNKGRAAASARGAAVRKAAASRPSASAAAGGSSRSGQLPAGDVRLTANIRADLHLELKIRAARERTTMGELIEAWIKSW